ncbi:hypothetical protein ACFX1T_038220 [Malus domestica]
MKVSMVRLLSRRLWNRGAINFSCFKIPLRTMPMPRVKRLAFVHQNLGNWSSHYYSLLGYSLVSSVVGFTVYDASNTSSKSTAKLSLDTMGKPILVQFPNLTLDRSTSVAEKCASFSANGTVFLSEMRLPGVCLTTEQGYVGIVSSKRLKTKKIQTMEKQAEEDLILENRCVYGSKISCAAFTRTMPALENGYPCRSSSDYFILR